MSAKPIMELSISAFMLRPVGMNGAKLLKWVLEIALAALGFYNLYTPSQSEQMLDV